MKKTAILIACIGFSFGLGMVIQQLTGSNAAGIMVAGLVGLCMSGLLS